MKSKFKLVTMLFVLGVLSLGIKATAEEKTKEYNEAWAASSVQNIRIINKFGEIKINNEGGSDVTIDVVITVDAPNEQKANELLDYIEVDFKKSGNNITAETKIDKGFKSRQEFSIDYTINIPTDKNLDISNKYGNTIINELNANGNFDIEHGSFVANRLNSSSSENMKLKLAYGKADISSTNHMDIEVGYSPVNIGEAENLKIESKYSVLKIEESKEVSVTSKYDTFEFEETESISGSAKYSHFKVEELKKNLNIDAGYGGISIEEVSKDFESISIENSYGQIKLGLDEASYMLDASCNYCGISYPENNFSGDKIKDNQTRIVKGKVGSGNGGNVYIRSKYGEIKLKK